MNSIMVQALPDYYTPSEQLSDIITSLGSDLNDLTVSQTTAIEAQATLLTAIEGLLDTIDDVLISQEDILQSIKDQSAVGPESANQFKTVTCGATSVTTLLAAWAGRTGAIIQGSTVVASEIRVGFGTGTSATKYTRRVFQGDWFEIVNYRGIVKGYNPAGVPVYINVTEW